MSGTKNGSRRIIRKLMAKALLFKAPCLPRVHPHAQAPRCAVQKAEGKEPEVVQPLTISENEFELVMGLFAKVTHEKTTCIM
jgi:hypothetical protein